MRLQRLKSSKRTVVLEATLAKVAELVDPDLIGEANHRGRRAATQMAKRIVVLEATLAKVAELVDAHDSKSCIFGCVGSIPTFGTHFVKAFSKTS